MQKGFEISSVGLKYLMLNLDPTPDTTTSSPVQSTTATTTTTAVSSDDNNELLSFLPNMPFSAQIVILLVIILAGIVVLGAIGYVVYRQGMQIYALQNVCICVCSVIHDILCLHF